VAFVRPYIYCAGSNLYTNVSVSLAFLTCQIITLKITIKIAIQSLPEDITSFREVMSTSVGDGHNGNEDGRESQSGSRRSEDYAACHLH